MDEARPQYPRVRNYPVRGGRENGPYACPCCHYVTLTERGGFEICPVCYWEDDGQDDPDADVVLGIVRPPMPNEIPRP